MRPRTVRLLLAAVVAVTGALALTHSAEAAGGGTTPAEAVPAAAVPAPLVPPAGNRLSAVFAATGVQVYRCTAGAWVFVEPAAHLVGVTTTAKPVTAVHFRGPSWESTDDGSLVEAAAVANVPVTGSIPQLLLKATTTRGAGLFGDVTYVQRLATSGGAAPAGECTDGRTEGVRYRAQYRFYRAA